MDDVVLIGQTDSRDKVIKFGIKTDDRRRHLYIIGRSGSGKTTIEETLAIHDIQSGRGVAVIDPHGEFSERLLNFVPKERVQDVIYLNPADTEHPVGFNVMESVDFDKRHIVASSLLSIFKKIWPDVWSARMEYIMNNTLLALLESPDSTLLSINRMLSDKDFRKDVVNNMKDPVVKAFWVDEFARYHDRFQIEAIAPLQNKVGQFISNPLIRNIIGQKVSKLDLRDIMDNKKILIVRLSTGLVGESNASLLGGLLITKLQQAAMSRIDTPEKDRQDFFLFIDEFQNFATDSFISILSEARKYRLNMTLAHQYIEQIPEEIQAAILGNVGSMVVFRIGARDAKILESEFEPSIEAIDLVNIPKWKFYIKLMIDGTVSSPFLASTLPPLDLPERTYVNEIIQYTREHYATPKFQVEKSITDWMETVAGEKVDRESNQEKDSADTYPGVCQSCGRGINVPFKPDPNKPLYCKQCLKKVKRPAVASVRPAPSEPKVISAPVEKRPRLTIEKPQLKNNNFKKQLASFLSEVIKKEETTDETDQVG